jgi:hypothetical protein
MLRPIVLLLLVLNLLFFAWSQGWIERITGQPAQAGREPERLNQQVAPESIKVVPASASAVRAAAAMPVCLESPWLQGEAGLSAAVSALKQAGVAADAWVDQRSDVPGVWAVATIRMGSSDFQARKEATLKRLNVAFEPLTGLPDEEPSLLISRHDSAEAAQKALDALAKRFVKGLRVLQIAEPGSTHRLRIEKADDALQARLAKLKDPALGSGFAACAVVPEAAASAAAATAPEAASAASR